ncbi:hypothetical protein E4U13_000942, partial [Claviceps humidiphila]
MDSARHDAHGPLMADTGSAHVLVYFCAPWIPQLQCSFSNDKLTPLSTAINVLAAVAPAIAAITTIAIITAIIMEFNEDHIEAPLKDFTPSPPSPSP